MELWGGHDKDCKELAAQLEAWPNLRDGTQLANDMRERVEDYEHVCRSLLQQGKVALLPVHLQHWSPVWFHHVNCAHVWHWKNMSRLCVARVTQVGWDVRNCSLVYLNANAGA